MNKVVEERARFHRPQHNSTEPCNKVNPPLRNSACHEAHSRRQGRPAAEVRTRGIIRTPILNKVEPANKLAAIVASYPVIGSNTVQAVRYAEPKQTEDKGLVWINQKQYFKGVPPEVWNFQVGGSQICQKWLKDREGRSLSNKDIRQYQRIVTALKEMIELMAGIDSALQNKQFKKEKLSNVARH